MVRPNLLVWITAGLCAFLLSGERAGVEAAAVSDSQGTVARTDGGVGAPESPQRYRFDGNLSGLHIETPEGQIRVEPGEDDSLLVELTRGRRADLTEEQHALAEQVELSPRLAGGRLSLIAKGPGSPMVWGKLAPYKVTIRTPAGWATARADALSAGLPAVKIETYGASVTIERIASVLQTDTVSGHVVLDGLAGRAEVNTVEGDIRATDCTWEWGKLNSSGADIHAAPLTLSDGDSLDLSSSVGSLEVLLPPGACCRVEADTTAGTVLTSIPQLRQGLRYSGRSLRAALCDGGALVRLRSTTGMIRIDAQAEPTTPED